MSHSLSLFSKGKKKDFFVAPGRKFDVSRVTKVLCMERALDVNSSHRATMGFHCEVLRGTVLSEPWLFPPP